MKQNIILIVGGGVMAILAMRSIYGFYLDTGVYFSLIEGGLVVASLAIVLRSALLICMERPGSLLSENRMVRWLQVMGLNMLFFLGIFPLFTLGWLVLYPGKLADGDTTLGTLLGMMTSSAYLLWTGLVVIGVTVWSLNKRTPSPVARDSNPSKT